MTKHQGFENLIIRKRTRTRSQENNVYSNQGQLPGATIENTKNA